MPAGVEIAGDRGAAGTLRWAARALGPTLERMVETGRLPGARLPLMTAVLDAINRDRPLAWDFARF